jgi:lipoprotein-anchoring transpeptidase ErfK/SrfK
MSRMGASVQMYSRPDTGLRAFFHNRTTLYAAMMASAALLAGAATPAQALPFNQQPAQQPTLAPPSDYARPVARTFRPSRVVTASRDKVAAKEKDSAQDIAPKARGLLSVIISIDKQQLTLYSDGQPIAHSRVSTGTPGHETPTGVFSVIQKDRWHHSNLYGDAPMYYMQRITWSGVAMHQGVVPNQPASHGCIRLPEAFARQLWGITKLGVRVIVAHSEVTPVAIAHDRLFTIKREPVEQPKLEAKLETPGQPGESSADVVREAYGALEVVQYAAAKQGATASDAPKLSAPALDAISYALGTPRETTSSDVVRSAYDTFAPVQPRRAKMLASVAAPDARPLKPGPISVFISRKEGKLFVRKGFVPVFDVPVTFEQPDQPLGTHVYTALAVQDDNTTMRWNVVTMPGSASARKSGKNKAVEVTGPASTAAQALDRVTIPPEALERISELMTPGASLIISDKGLGGETGVGTDFIVLTR